MGNNPDPVLEGIKRSTESDDTYKDGQKVAKTNTRALDRREAPATHTKAHWGPCQMQEQSRDPQADEPADSPWMLP
jgi:hypothetical protein